MNTPSFVEWTIDNVPTHAWLCHSNVDIDTDTTQALDGFMCLSSGTDANSLQTIGPVLTSMRYKLSIRFDNYEQLVGYLNRKKLTQIPTTTSYKLMEKMVLREI